MSKPQREDARPEDQDEVTEASIESFPASDPPAFNASKPPKRRQKKAAPAADKRQKTVAHETRPNGADPSLTTAEVRGRIPSGRTMGVSSAREPSAAPFDTDDEAAGRAAGVAAMRTTLAEEARLNGAHAPRVGERRRADSTRGMVIAIAVLVALVVLAWLWLA